MNTVHRFARQTLISIAAVAAAGYASFAFSGEVKVLLAGNQEVPQVTTPASGSGSFTVGDDGSISGSVSTISIEGTAAHIHEGPPSGNGPVIVPLTKTSANVWSVPAGAKLTEAQMKSYKAGQLYVNVHSVANKGGEIRGQLEPK